MTLLLGPQKLIKKRYHKMLDYENVRLKQKNVRDADQAKMVCTEETLHLCLYLDRLQLLTVDLFTRFVIAICVRDSEEKLLI